MVTRVDMRYSSVDSLQSPIVMGVALEAIGCQVA
jgi:hypothetical protein